MLPLRVEHAPDPEAAAVRRRNVLGWLAAAAPGLAAAQPAPRPVLAIGTQGGTPSLLGTIAEEVVLQACRRAGIDLKVARLPLMRSIELANRGEIDGDMMRIADVAQRYPNLVRVPTPVAHAHVVVYVRAGAAQRLPREQVGQLLIAYTRGTFVLVKHAQGLRTVEVDNVDQVFGMLAAARVEAGLATYLDAEQALQRLQLVAAVVRWPQVWAIEPVYLFLHRSREDSVPLLDAALRQMAQKGAIDRVYRDMLKAEGIQPLPPGGAHPR